MTRRSKIQFIVLLVLVAFLLSALIALVRVAAQVPCIPPACSTPAPSPTGNQTAAPGPSHEAPAWTWTWAQVAGTLLATVVAVWATLRIVLPGKTFDRLMDFCGRRRRRPPPDKPR